MSDELKFNLDGRGPLSVWEEPKDGAVYTIGVDAAEGIYGGDNSAACVIDVHSMEQVAEWAGIADPYLFAEHVVALARYYNNSMVAIEVNGHGLSVLNRVRDIGYWNLYNRRAFDQVQRTWINKQGWHTNVRTKLLMVDHARRVIRAGESAVNSQELISELSTMIVMENGSVEAQRGAHDDRAMAWMIALQAREVVFEEKPEPDSVTKRHADSWIWDKIETQQEASVQKKREQNYAMENLW